MNKLGVTLKRKYTCKHKHSFEQEESYLYIELSRESPLVD